MDEKNLLYTIFFRDYGKLLVTKKQKTREKSIDIWYAINCEINTSSSRNIHIIWNIKISNQFIYEDKNYEIIQQYLILLRNILIDIPVWVPHIEIYDTINFLNTESSNTNLQKIILTQIKIKTILWEISLENKNITIQKVLKFINTHKIHDIFRLGKLENNIINTLKLF